MPQVIQSVVNRIDVREPEVWLCSKSHIGTQVCRGGTVETNGCIINKRYIPPGSTCVMRDGVGTVVHTILREEPPPASGGGFNPISK